MPTDNTSRPPSGMRILGLDPGFSSMGWALIETTPKLDSIGAGVIRTKPNKTAKKCDDNVARMQTIAEALSILHEKHRFAVIAAEAQSWTRFANADRAVAMAWGVIAATAEIFNCPIIQIRPQDAKKRLSGKLSASKGEIQTIVEERIAGSKMHLAELAKTQQNHASDAYAVALASLSHPLIQAVRRMR